MRKFGSSGFGETREWGELRQWIQAAERNLTNAGVMAQRAVENNMSLIRIIVELWSRWVRDREPMVRTSSYKNKCYRFSFVVFSGS